MNFELDKYGDNFLFIPLGGSGEIGMNVNLYYLDGKWLMIDLGAGFADEALPGVDLIVANIEFIKQHVNNLLAIVLTHAHEDHLGAVQYLWDDLRVPVYATNFTANFLKEKLKEFGYNEDDVPIHHLEEGSRLTLGGFDLELVHITHSVPEMNAVFIRTKHGNILHTGDWKIDRNPVVGDEPDFTKLKSFGKEGVLAVVGDSTNVFNDGYSGTEGDLKDSLEKIVVDSSGMVVVTTFASNVARLESIMSAAKKANRKIAIAGRSLHRVLSAAQASGYLTEHDHIISTREIKQYNRNEVLVLATGCQGEPLASVNKMAYDSHPDFKLASGDTIVFSSKIIPGNDKRIFKLFNVLTDKNVRLLTEKNSFVHVSGHPNREEIQEMYGIIQPKYVVPVHGELMHMNEHKRLAKSWGYDAIVPRNGSVLSISAEKGIKQIGEVDSGYQAVDGHCLISPDSGIMNARRKLSRDGFAGVIACFDKKNSSNIDVVLLTPGALDENDDVDLKQNLINMIKKELQTTNKKKLSQSVRSRIKSVVSKFFKSEVGKVPLINIEVKSF